MKKNIVNSTSKDILKAELEYDKIKQMYMSYDSGKLSSTIINLDIEELTHCLGCAILKHIEFSIKNHHGTDSEEYIQFMKNTSKFLKN